MAQPAFNPTPKLRRSVSIAAGAGVSHEEIALGMGISRPTLEKYFAFELTTGAYQRRQEVLDAMFRAAKKGNVAAQKAYAALTPKPAAPPLPQPGATDKLPVGKKARAQADATTAQAGTDWETLLPAGRVQ